MPTHFKCSIPDCKSGGPKDDRKGVTIYSFPTDEALFQKWIVQIKENVDPTFSYKPTSRVCGLHFRGGRKLGGNNIPTVFNQNRNIMRDIGDDCDTEYRDVESASSLELNSQNCDECTDITDLNVGLQPEEDIDLCSDDENHYQTIKSPTDSKTDETENMTEIYKMVNSKNEKISELLDLIQKKNAEIDRLKSENEYLRNKCDARRNKTNRFSIEKFSENDSAIKFYTGLPDYASFIALFNFVKAEDGYQLNYNNNKKDNEPKSASVSKRGRPRSLSDMNELFLTLTRLRLDLLEEDLHFRFEMPQTTVSEIFITWTDRLHYCLSSFDQIPGLEEGLRNLLPECFKGEFEDIDLIIDCTEVFIEKPSDPIAQSATWSEYKEHNTGKILIGLSPVGFPRFVSDAFPGSISDDDITQASGILSLARQNKRWLADKGWQSDGDKFGLTIETPDRLEGKLQFSEPEDIRNRKISRLRIHVERLIRRIKVYRILKSVIPLRYANLASKIFRVCGLLTAFLPPLIKQTDVSYLKNEE